MPERRFTEPQLRALLFLPPNGDWVIKVGKTAPALDSLHLYHRALVEHEFGDFGPRGGRCGRWRLTAEGQKEALHRQPAMQRCMHCDAYVDECRCDGGIS